MALGDTTLQVANFYEAQLGDDAASFAPQLRIEAARFAQTSWWHSDHRMLETARCRARSAASPDQIQRLLLCLIVRHRIDIGSRCPNQAGHCKDIIAA